MAFSIIDRQPASSKMNSAVLLLSDEAASNALGLVYSTDIGIGTRVMILSVRIEYVATATVGTRIPTLVILDSALDTIRVVRTAQGTPTASQTINMEIAPGNLNNAGTSPAGNVTLHSLPDDLFLLPGQTLAIVDLANIDVNDDMIAHVYVRAVF